MGVLSCLLVTRGAGAAYGELMASAPIIAQYESLAADISARTGEAETPGRGPEALVASNVTFTYPGSHAPVITDASMRIKPGEFVAFVGANGSGKTTFAKPLGGILEPDAGTIAIGQASDAASRRARSAMVFQDFTRFEVTVRRFVDPLLRHSDDQIEAALRAAQAWSYIAPLPGAIDAQLGPQWDGAGLSGGQWQRLALLASCCRIGTRGSSMSRPRPSTRTRRPRSTSSSPN
ncbi:ABC transporter [Bowdeniella nasicola]|uniref:ABC transporter n=1 Tax=Bowdeniella nasicola TaxID=208480 RepID=A0A1H3Z096_9ACTO|nr:ABC transporter [Bowdeniella nasicola]